jgi:hypothetical protein
MEEHVSRVDQPSIREPREMTQDQREVAMGPLLPKDMVQDLQSRWNRIQTGFVDEPRTAVQRADALVTQAIKNLAENFAASRNPLEEQWNRGNDVSTEDLRLALKQYRTFFDRLLAV